jgi:large subunit ribosomal protein L25
MAEQASLAAQRRDVHGKKVRQLRRQGIIPANVFGRGRDSTAIQVQAHDLKRLLAAHGGTRLISLRIDGADEAALLRHVQHDPRTGAIEHVDFMHVEMTQPIRARVPVRLIGEAPAVRVLGGVLLHMSDAIEVECLPRDLPESVELDISQLDQLDATLHVSDVVLPPKVTLLDDPNEPLVKVTPTRVTEEVPAPAEAAAPAPEAAPPTEAESPGA